MRWQERVVYAEPQFARPQAVLAYLSRHTHRVAQRLGLSAGRLGGLVNVALVR